MLSMKGFGFDGPKCAPSVFAALAVTQSTCSTMFDKTIRVILFPQSACVHLNAVFVCPILRAPELVNRIPAAGACVFSASVLSGNRFVLAFSPLEVARLLARPQPPPPQSGHQNAACGQGAFTSKALSAAPFAAAVSVKNLRTTWARGQTG